MLLVLICASFCACTFVNINSNDIRSRCAYYLFWLETSSAVNSQQTGEHKNWEHKACNCTLFPREHWPDKSFYLIDFCRIEILSVHTNRWLSLAIIICAGKTNCQKWTQCIIFDEDIITNKQLACKCVSLEKHNMSSDLWRVFRKPVHILIVTAIFSSKIRVCFESKFRTNIQQNREQCSENVFPLNTNDI